jgi:hypothetical protein
VQCGVNRLNLESELIGAYYDAMGDAPELQFAAGD